MASSIFALRRHLPARVSHKDQRAPGNSPWITSSKPSKVLTLHPDLPKLVCFTFLQPWKGRPHGPPADQEKRPLFQTALTQSQIRFKKPKKTGTRRGQDEIWGHSKPRAKVKKYMWLARPQTHADKGMYTSPRARRPFNKQHKNITFYTLTRSVTHITHLHNVSIHVGRVCLCGELITCTLRLKMHDGLSSSSSF